MSAATVVIADPLDGDSSVLETRLVSSGFTVKSPGPGESWLKLAQQAHGLIVNLVRVDETEFRSLECCRVIARLGVGVNNIDLSAARSRGITVTHVPDYCREEVSEHALALILAVARKLPLANADVEGGVWRQLGYRPIHRLSTLTLGLIGYGRVARTLANKAAALGLRVVAHDPYVVKHAAASVPLITLDELLRDSDVVSLHAPLVADTHGLIGQAELRKMKRGSILINTSRGELVDEVALIAALDANHLAAAALDVAATEPIARDSRLLGRRNVLLTPHMAFYSEESLAELQRVAADDVALALSGQAPRFRVA